MLVAPVVVQIVITVPPDDKIVSAAASLSGIVILLSPVAAPVNDTPLSPLNVTAPKVCATVKVLVPVTVCDPAVIKNSAAPPASGIVYVRSAAKAPPTRDAENAVLPWIVIGPVPASSSRMPMTVSIVEMLRPGSDRNSLRCICERLLITVPPASPPV